MSGRVEVIAARICVYFSVFFFFQAEDGIRDLTVTGVQTCALPIFSTAGLACAPRPCTRPAKLRFERLRRGAEWRWRAQDVTRKKQSQKPHTEPAGMRHALSLHKGCSPAWGSFLSHSAIIK